MNYIDLCIILFIIYYIALAEIISIDMFVTEDYGPIVGVTLIIKKVSGRFIAELHCGNVY